MFHEVRKRIEGTQDSHAMSDQEMEQWYRFIQNAVEEAKMSGRNNPRGYPRFASSGVTALLDALYKAVARDNIAALKSISPSKFGLKKEDTRKAEMLLSAIIETLKEKESDARELAECHESYLSRYASKRVANRFLEANSRSLLTEGDEGFRYVGSDIYNMRDMAKHWAKGKPFHFIKEMPNGKMEEQELIFQAFPSRGVLEVHIKGITHSDESDGNFTTHHGLTYYSSHSVSSVDELNAFIKSFKPKPSQMKSLYYQIIENDGGWMG